MMLVNTGAKKYRMRLLYAIRLAGISRPKVTVVDDVLGVSFGNLAKLATIVQHPTAPSCFVCQTFVRLKPNSLAEIDLEDIDGPARLLEFLDAAADWLE